jgi:LPPG:FO 2-phospho-L-lactate transferase
VGSPGTRPAITALAGGTGAAKLLRGLTRSLDPAALTIVGNTGDDLEWWGLHVSPDLDSVAYALAGVLDPGRGWGWRDDSFVCRDQVARLGGPTWFQIGDRDLATHLVRTGLLRAGATLSQATAGLAARLGLTSRLLPMSDDPVRTLVHVPGGTLTLEEFFVRERCQPPVNGVTYEGAAMARPAPGVLEALGSADAVVVCCSNPVTSIGPILAVPGVVEALLATPAPVVAVSPIVGDTAVSGPAAKLLLARGLPATVGSVARVYSPWLDVLVMDRRDAGRAAEVEACGVRPALADALMPDGEAERALGQAVLAAVGLDGGSGS